MVSIPLWFDYNISVLEKNGWLFCASQFHYGSITTARKANKYHSLVIGLNSTMVRLQRAFTDGLKPEERKGLNSTMVRLQLYNQ